MRLTKMAAGMAAAVLSLGLLAGCSDDEGTTTGGKGGSDTVDTASGEELTKDNFAQTISAAMAEAGSTHVKMTSTGSVGLEAEGDQVIGENPADSAIQMTMDLGGMKAELRLVDEFVYMNMGTLTQNKFAKIDLNDKNNPMVEQFGSLASDVDLSKQFEKFGASIKEFKKGGAAEQIDGVDAQPYDLTVDAKKMAEDQGEDASMMPAELTYTFFIGPDNLVRRMSTEVMGTGLTMDFSKWGEKVTVEAPADSEVSDADLAELFGGAAQ